MGRSDAELALFSVRERTNGKPAGHAESSFAFLDRVAQPYWERIRIELDSWFADFPRGESARDLRSRFRKDDHRQHYAAWWELYLHRLLTRQGFEVEVHPALPDTADRPDFRVHSPSGSFFLEAATTFSGIDDGEEHSLLEARIMDVVDQGRSENFTISFNFSRIGTEMPRVAEITRPIEKWLDQLDPDATVNEAADSPAASSPCGTGSLNSTRSRFLPSIGGPLSISLAWGPLSRAASTTWRSCAKR